MTSTRPQAIVAHPYPDLYGADRMVLRSINALERHGWDVLLVVPETGPLLHHVNEQEVRYRVVDIPVLRKALLSVGGITGLVVRAPSEIGRLRRILRDTSPNVVYVNTLTLPHWLVAARLESVPVVCHVRELESEISDTVATGLTAPLRLAQIVVANSHATRSFLVRHQPCLAERTRVIYNGYPFTDAPVTPAFRPRRCRFTVIGRLSPRKGQDLAISALATLVAAGHDIELHLVGDVFRGYDWYKGHLIEQAKKLRVHERVTLHGFQPDVWPHLAAADVVAVPSRLEPFGSVAVEALAARRPVIVSNVGGLPEIVRHERTGLVVPENNATALAAGVARLLNDVGEATRLADEGFRDVRTRFVLDRYERELVSTFRAATAGGG
jgi:glycosyltransferase involved in cell wall biosynthesis